MWFIQIKAISLSSDGVVTCLWFTYIESPDTVSSCVFSFTRKSLEDVLRRLNEVFKTSSQRRLNDIVKKGRLNVHFTPI